MFPGQGLIGSGFTTREGGFGLQATLLNVKKNQASYR